MSFWTWFKSQNHRGHAMDLLVFLSNLFLLGSFTKLLQRLGAGFTNNDDAAARGLAWVVLIAFLAYMLGAILKRAPLHERVKMLPNPDYVGCILIGWVSLHLTLSILGAALIAAGFDAAPKGIPVTLMISLSILPTFLVLRVIFRPKKLDQIAAWRKSWPMELLADIFIVSAVIMLTIMWNLWIADLFYVTFPGHTFGDKLFGAALAAGAFALFYITPRFLFLVEDFNRWLTWATIGLTLAPVIGRIMLG
jgi:hypothetical protein